MQESVRGLADSILHNPELIVVGNRRNPAETVIQQVCSVAQDRKMDLLFHVLRTEPVENVLVFSRTKHRADRITKKLEQVGFTATALHSNKSQNQRQRALDGFKSGKYQIMVATDIAARGIDVDGISHVINFDTPNQPEDYIHRIGRTGRAEATGDAITFVANDEMSYLKQIERHTGVRLDRKVYDGFESRSTAPTSDETRRSGNSFAYGRSNGNGRGGYAPNNGNSRSYGRSGSGGNAGPKSYRNARKK
jgi:ATP-dependent RNA helicase RhlE